MKKQLLFSLQIMYLLLLLAIFFLKGFIIDYPLVLLLNQQRYQQGLVYATEKFPTSSSQIIAWIIQCRIREVDKYVYHLCFHRIVEQFVASFSCGYNQLLLLLPKIHQSNRKTQVSSHFFFIFCGVSNSSSWWSRLPGIYQVTVGLSKVLTSLITDN